MNGRSYSSRWTWSNAFPFSVFPLAKNFRIILLKSVGLTVLRSTVILLFSHHFSNLCYTPLSFLLGVLRLSFLLNFIQLLLLSKSELWLQKSWKFGTSKCLNVKRSLQNYKVSMCKLIHKNSRQFYHWNGILRISLAERSCLTYLLPTRIRAEMHFQPAHFPFGPHNGSLSPLSLSFMFS